MKKPNKSSVKSKKLAPEIAQPSIADIVAQVRALTTSATRPSEAFVARQLGVRPRTLNAWLNGSIECRHRQMLALALEALKARLTH